MSPRLVLTLGFSVLLTSCGYYHEGKQTTPQASFGAQATLGFEVMKVVMERNRCNECHTEAKGNKGGVNLETYANAKAVAPLILSTVNSGDMPMGGPEVSAGDQAIIAAWVEAGAPETSTIPVPGSTAPIATNPVVVPTPDPVVTPTPEPEPEKRYDFAAIQAAIFAPYCVQCHKGFATYAKVQPRLTEIQSAILSDEMPKDGLPLSADLKAMLGEWISDGAPETLN